MTQLVQYCTFPLQKQMCVLTPAEELAGLLAPPLPHHLASTRRGRGDGRTRTRTRGHAGTGRGQRLTKTFMTTSEKLYYHISDCRSMIIYNI